MLILIYIPRMSVLLLCRFKEKLCTYVSTISSDVLLIGRQKVGIFFSFQLSFYLVDRIHRADVHTCAGWGCRIFLASVRNCLSYVRKHCANAMAAGSAAPHLGLTFEKPNVCFIKNDTHLLMYTVDHEIGPCMPSSSVFVEFMIFAIYGPKCKH